MEGEGTASDREPAGSTAPQSSFLQPGGRRPAPGELALVQAFINSHYDLEFNHGADLLGSAAAAERWLARHALRASVAARDLERLRTIREGLRQLARGNGEGADLALDERAFASINDSVRGAAVEIRLTPEGPRFLPAAAGQLDGAVGLLLAITAQSIVDGSWQRLKICPGENCGWAFYDHSRNGTGRWCSMAVCGGRAKARAHYHRTRGGHG
jgi:predicted RNA-binding Zn ribbon-like protein